MLKINNLNFTYSDGTQALNDVSMEISSEHIFAIMGLSGSGKTTLLNCIARFLQPQSGEILLNDEPIEQIHEIEFREKIGVVFQRLNLFPHLTILKNMTLAPCKVEKRPAAQVKKGAMEMLERLGIPELAESYPSQISGGQAQRAAIARGLMLKPQYMLLDEPTSALDAQTTFDFANWLIELQADTSFIIVTHDLPFSRQAAEYGVYMEDGQVKESGKINEILERADQRRA